MAPRRRSTSPWTAFRRRHPRSPFLKAAPLYAVPVKLIDAVTKHVRDFWSDDEVAFERDLTATAGGGFFLQQPFPCPLSPPPPDPSTAVASAAALETETNLLRDHGLNQLQIDHHRKCAEQQRQHADLRALAYAGWLVTNSGFVAERDQVREHYADWVQERGRFPAEPLSFLGERSAVTDRTEAAFLLFLRRWGLRTLSTWDLPVPMRPQTGVLIHPEAAGSPDAGVCVFLPWYLLRDKQFDVHELTGWLRTLIYPDHLRGWLDRSPGKKNLGYVRLKNLFALHRCLRLAPATRYPDRVAGNTERLDQALADFLDVGADSVKKLRLELSRLTPPA